MEAAIENEVTQSHLNQNLVEAYFYCSVQAFCKCLCCSMNAKLWCFLNIIIFLHFTSNYFPVCKRNLLFRSPYQSRFGNFHLFLQTEMVLAFFCHLFKAPIACS